MTSDYPGGVDEVVVSVLKESMEAFGGEVNIWVS
jgi:hypothetical protein